MAADPLILDIRGNCLDDGPGIRTVVFFKGCPLSCSWCHNPESKSGRQEIGFDAGDCAGCDTCLPVCPESALSRQNRFFIDRSRCTLCFACADACPSGALSRVGTPTPVPEIVRQVLKDKPFFETSGGGLTLSGGEPTFSMGALSELVKEAKIRTIHTLLETCGHFDFSRFHESVLPWLDAVYFDIKLMDPAAHRRHCGVGNEKILENFKNLAEWSRKNRFQLLARTPLIPGITDTEENLGAIAGFLRRVGTGRIQLMAYNPLWVEKTAKIGNPAACFGDASMTTWMPGEKVSACRRLFHEAGIETV